MGFATRTVKKLMDKGVCPSLPGAAAGESELLLTPISIHVVKYPPIPQLNTELH